MSRIVIGLFFSFLVFSCVNRSEHCDAVNSSEAMRISDSLAIALNWPSDLKITYFAGPEVTPSPACIAVAAGGEVFVGVDMIGSLGKRPGKGAIIRLVDCNNDGVADRHTEFAKVDNPRGIIALGEQVFVLHTVFSEETEKATGMDLVVFKDVNKDGIADGPSKPLIRNISSYEFLQSRGTDHATNGIRMGIDGWIYIAVGDFGFHNAVDRSGTTLTMLGGGIVRVRPDGTEMEVYTHGMRNIYDVAIDPYMNIFTRGNTNDGGGWNVRFSHQIQSGEYGYPVLFKHFTNEIIPALVDVGGGSGTGALFLDDARWPDKYNRVPMMADWGRNHLFIHRVTADGAGFTQKDEEFLRLPQITDLDIDGSGRLYLSAWDGAGYKGDSSKGFVVRAVPQGWEHEPFRDLKESSVKELVSLLKAGNAVGRLQAQQELLLRPVSETAGEVWDVIVDESLSVDVRVAGIFTYAQISREDGIDKLVTLVSDERLKEFALRALADRKPFLKSVPIEPFLKALNDSSKRVKVAAAVGLGRLGRIEAADALLTMPAPLPPSAPGKDMIGPHAIPNSSVIPAHVAVRALVSLHAVDACIRAVGSENSAIALWALRYMHDPKVVEGLVAFYKQTKNDDLKEEILTTLSRLYKKEAAYDGSWWWGTRPDTHGPYYRAIEWESSPAIREFLVNEWKASTTSGRKLFADLNGKHRMGISMFGGEEPEIEIEGTKINLARIQKTKGMIGKSSIEDIMLALDRIQGNAALGKTLFEKQGCVACHSIKGGESLKGPFMGQIGSIMSRERIAESILKPDASISQGFASVLITTKDDKTHAGFISEESADKVVMRDMTGAVSTIKTEDIVSRKELETSMMPAGLANSLSYEEFASLVTFLSRQKR